MILTKRISTGIQDLDSLLDGGLLSGQSYLISGGPGTGKSVFSLQFLKNGLEGGERAIYVTVNEKANRVLEAAASLGWHLQPYIEKNLLRVLDASNYHRFNNASRGKGAYLDLFITEISNHASLIKATRLVIDPISPLLLANFADLTTQECAHVFIDMLESRLPTTNLLTAYSLQTNEGDLNSNPEEYYTAGVLALRMCRKNKNFVRSLFVKKMRGTSVDPNEYEFQIRKGDGIVLSHEKPARTRSNKTTVENAKNVLKFSPSEHTKF